MNIIELSLTSPYGSYACDTNLDAYYDPTIERYSFSGNYTNGGRIAFVFDCQDNPLQENSNIQILGTYFELEDTPFSIRLTGTPSIKIGYNEYVVTYEDCRLPFDGSTAKIVCRWSE